MCCAVGISLDEILRFKSMVEKNGQLVSGTKAELVHCNLSHFIFPQGVISSDGLEKEGGEEKKREKEK